MKKKKDVGLKIQFDDKEYSKEEQEFYIQRYFNILAEAKGYKVPQTLGKAIVEYASKLDETGKEIRTSEIQ